jgi:phospholipid/cholesterol/gamma-HCH transport system substrate-binding protein
MRSPILKPRWAPVAFVLAMVVVAAGVLWRVDEPVRRLAAYFTATVGLHPGSDVRILGVRVGEVVAVTPRGRTVRVDMRYDAGQDVPADARAVIVPPSVVSDRYVQLAPAYAGGPVLADGAELPVERTAVPLEVDDIFRALDEVNRALGPTGANADGALSDLVETARRNLEGNGQRLHDTLDGLSRALSTLSDGREDLFGTVANLAEFTTALARSDTDVREFNRRLADVAQLLAAERDDLAAALRDLSVALADLTGFVRSNREALASNVAALADITGVLVRQQRALIDTLDVGPLALSNLNLAYNARSGTLDTRDNALGPYDPAAFVCSLMVNAVPIQQIPKACFDLARLLHDRGRPMSDELRRLLGLPANRPPSGSPPTPGGGPAGPVVSEVRDLTLGGILRGGRS